MYTCKPPKGRPAGILVFAASKRRNKHFDYDKNYKNTTDKKFCNTNVDCSDNVVMF